MASKRKRDTLDLPAESPASSAAASSSSPTIDHNGLEALGLAQEQARRRESTGSLSSKYWLSLLSQPPRHPFVRSYFPIKIVLVDSKRALKTGWPLTLSVELLYENGEMVENQSKHLEIYNHDEHRPIILPASGTLDLKVRILTCSMAHENKNMFLRFIGVPADKSVPAHVSILNATSNLMTVIRHRLRITEAPPALWYKDEGGRDNSMKICGLLVDEFEQPVQGREVPLKVILCYEGEECAEVKNQSILKMPTDCLPKVDKFGKFTLKVRVEEVSKNHQKQSFVIKIAPDVNFSPDNFDISADISNPINVLSKRNKRRPKGSGNDEDSPDHGPSLPHYQPPLFSLPGTTAAAATMPPGALKLPHVSTSTAPLAGAASNTLPSITPSGTAAKPHAIGASMTKLTSTDGSSLLLNDSSEYKPAPSPNFSETISHLINWCQHVNDLFGKIEWQHVGFEVNDEGQLNLHRPLYRCSSCWAYQDTIRQTGHRDSCKLSKLNSAYRSHVHVYLQDLLNMATGGSGASGNSLPPASAPGNNPALTSSNSLMAAYSKNNSGNVFLSHSNSSNNNARNSSFVLPSSGPSLIQQHSMGLGLSHTNSLMQTRAASQSGLAKQESTSSLSQQHSNHNVGTNASSSSPPPPSASLSLTKDKSLAVSSNDSPPSSEPPLKKLRSTDHSGLFPQSSGGTTNTTGDIGTNWQNLSSLESIPIDRNMSLAGPPILGDRGFSALAPLDGLVGANAYVSLGQYPSSDGTDAYMSDMPPGSLSLLRGASSINPGGSSSAMALETMMTDRAEESAVDAIHVTATPFGFPAFGIAKEAPGGSHPAFPSNLVGFYQYDETTSFLVFVPLTKFPTIRPDQIKEIERIYRGLREADTAAGSNEPSAASRILTRAQCITLDKLKEQALLTHYSDNAAGYLQADAQ